LRRFASVFLVAALLSPIATADLVSAAYTSTFYDGFVDNTPSNVWKYGSAHEYSSVSVKTFFPGGYGSATVTARLRTSLGTYSVSGLNFATLSRRAYGTPSCKWSVIAALFPGDSSMTCSGVVVSQ
jgi:hypothetical protein